MDYYFTMAPADSAGATRRVVFDEQLPLKNWNPQYVFTGGLLQDTLVNGLFTYPRSPPQILTVVP